MSVSSVTLSQQQANKLLLALTKQLNNKLASVQSRIQPLNGDSLVTAMAKDIQDTHVLALQSMFEANKIDEKTLQLKTSKWQSNESFDTIHNNIFTGGLEIFSNNLPQEQKIQFDTAVKQPGIATNLIDLLEKYSNNNNMKVLSCFIKAYQNEAESYNLPVDSVVQLISF